MSSAAAVSPTTHKQAMLVEWRLGAQILAVGHFNAAKRASRCNDLLGAAVIAATAIAGSTVFATLGSLRPAWRIAAGVISLLATLLASEQKYLRYEERATRHHEAGRAYQSLRQQTELLLVRLQDGSALSDDQLEFIRSRRDEIEKAAPTIPEKMYQRAKDNVMNCKDCPKVAALAAAAAGSA